MAENDNGNPVPDDLPPPGIGTPEPITILITYDRGSGNLNIQGPISDRVLTYGILEAAKEALVKMGMEHGKSGAQGSRILTPFRR